MISTLLVDWRAIRDWLAGCRRISDGARLDDFQGDILAARWRSRCWFTRTRRLDRANSLGARICQLAGRMLSAGACLLASASIIIHSFVGASRGNTAKERKVKGSARPASQPVSQSASQPSARQVQKNQK